MNHYVFDQNNSGGRYEGPKFVIVQAGSDNEADDLAEEFAGVYFNGVASLIDCECCGDRWRRTIDEFDTYADAYEHCLKRANYDDILFVNCFGQMVGNLLQGLVLIC